MKITRDREKTKGGEREGERIEGGERRGEDRGRGVDIPNLTRIIRGNRRRSGQRVRARRGSSERWRGDRERRRERKRGFGGAGERRVVAAGGALGVSLLSPLSLLSFSLLLFQ
jgi:hypothetical protein